MYTVGSNLHDSLLPPAYNLLLSPSLILLTVLYSSSIPPGTQLGWPVWISYLILYVIIGLQSSWCFLSGCAVVLETSALNVYWETHTDLHTASVPMQCTFVWTLHAFKNYQNITNVFLKHFLDKNVSIQISSCFLGLYLFWALRGSLKIQWGPCEILGAGSPESPVLLVLVTA